VFDNQLLEFPQQIPKRYLLTREALAPSMKIIAPWRIDSFISKFRGRADLLEYARINNIPVSSTPKAPWRQVTSSVISLNFEGG